jgi:hypothetical protein
MEPSTPDRFRPMVMIACVIAVVVAATLWLARA